MSQEICSEGLCRQRLPGRWNLGHGPWRWCEQCGKWFHEECLLGAEVNLAALTDAEKRRYPDEGGLPHWLQPEDHDLDGLTDEEKEGVAAWEAVRALPIRRAGQMGLVSFETVLQDVRFSNEDDDEWEKSWAFLRKIICHSTNDSLMQSEARMLWWKRVDEAVRAFKQVAGDEKYHQYYRCFEYHIC